MLREKTLSMLGLARRANKLSMGHDMAQLAIKKGRAKLILFCSDVSPRLVNEFTRTLENLGKNIPIIKTDISMQEIHTFVGYKAGVLTVDDENFAVRISSLLKQEENVNDN
ncbi:MAG: ribosomal L7Ae/L30e/S12e/Gadd45 family protein [Clostridiales bacterium]|nr:ribosomal L7Ae/L30e/S12e/Gadd45 family protein [Clostridiales bacterium]